MTGRAAAAAQAGGQAGARLHLVADYRRIPLPEEPPIPEDAPTWNEYEAPLVYGAISQRDYQKAYVQRPQAFLVYPNSCKVWRDPELKTQPPRAKKRGVIDAFSDKSRRRLRLAAVDAFPALTSQFVLTYPAQFPQDGRETRSI